MTILDSPAEYIRNDKKNQKCHLFLPPSNTSEYDYLKVPDDSEKELQLPYKNPSDFK